MINRIQSIKNLGVFNNWNAPNDIIFNKYNLFYGWNGSGKSTLTKIFRSMEFKEPIEGFVEYEFELDTKDPNTNVNQAFETVPPNIKVFNQEFVQENTKFEKGTTESILYIGKDKGELKEEVDKTKIKLAEAQLSFNNNSDTLQKSIDKRENFFIESGKELKAFFSNTIYSQITYNKRTASDIWAGIEETSSLTDCTLDEYVFSINKAFIAQNQSKVKFDKKFTKIDLFDSTLYKEVVDLLNSNPVIKSIERLQKHNDIASWVQQGIAIHQKHQSNNCEFCGEKLRDEKLLQLSSHFNDEFIQFQNSIRRKQEEIKKLFIDEIALDPNLFYSDYEIPLKDENNYLKQCIDSINEGLKFYLRLLESKFINPLQPLIATKNISPGYFTQLNQSIDNLNGIIEHHNKRVDEFEVEANKRQSALEKHYIANRAIDEKFKSLLGLIVLQTKTKTETDENIKVLSENIQEKEILLQNEEFAIIKINTALHKFLGRNEISLEKNEGGGYILRRNGLIALNLSEGEKTAIALIYFIVKISEKDNEIANTIIVFDDPISSLDSNHLFNASSYITSNCSNAKQLIILTHNFWFFKLIRDWMQNKNSNKNKKNKEPIASFFEIKNGKICFADKSLIEYNSEYHYVFKKLFEFKAIDVPGLDESFVIANAARRVLESFSMIKTPHAPGLSSILKVAQNKGIDINTIEKIYYFLNKYSHLDRIESFENTIENITGESTQVVSDILSIIKKIDEDHYKSMDKMCEIAQRIIQPLQTSLM